MTDTYSRKVALAEWLAQQLSTLLPSSVTITADRGNIILHSKGLTSESRLSALQFSAPSDKENLASLAYRGLSDIQDFVADMTTEVWPKSKAVDVRNLAEIETTWEGDRLHASFIYKGQPIVTLQPFALETLS